MMTNSIEDEELQYYEDELYKERSSDDESELEEILYGQAHYALALGEESLKSNGESPADVKTNKECGNVVGDSSFPELGCITPFKYALGELIPAEVVDSAITEKKKDPKSTKDEWRIDDRDDDTIKRPRPQNRYYLEETDQPTCYACDKKGHIARDCTEAKKEFPCYLCGHLGHFRRDCPDIICFNCWKIGHTCKICPEPRRKRYCRCRRCKVTGHDISICPEIWRQFHVTVKNGSIKKSHISKYQYCGKEMLTQRFCYNCASSDHYGWKCTEYRMNPRVPYTQFIVNYDRCYPPHQTDDPLLSPQENSPLKQKDSTKEGSKHPQQKDSSTEQKNNPQQMNNNPKDLALEQPIVQRKSERIRLKSLSPSKELITIDVKNKLCGNDDVKRNLTRCDKQKIREVVEQKFKKTTEERERTGQPPPRNSLWKRLFRIEKRRLIKEKQKINYCETIASPKMKKKKKILETNDIQHDNYIGQQLTTEEKDTNQMLFMLPRAQQGYHIDNNMEISDDKNSTGSRTAGFHKAPHGITSKLKENSRKHKKESAEYINISSQSISDDEDTRTYFENGNSMKSLSRFEMTSELGISDSDEFDDKLVSKQRKRKREIITSTVVDISSDEEDVDQSEKDTNKRKDGINNNVTTAQNTTGFEASSVPRISDTKATWRDKSKRLCKKLRKMSNVEKIDYLENNLDVLQQKDVEKHLLQLQANGCVEDKSLTFKERLFSLQRKWTTRLLSIRTRKNVDNGGHKTKKTKAASDKQSKKLSLLRKIFKKNRRMASPPSSGMESDVPAKQKHQRKLVDSDIDTSFMRSPQKKKRKTKNSNNAIYMDYDWMPSPPSSGMESDVSTKQKHHRELVDYSDIDTSFTKRPQKKKRKTENNNDAINIDCMPPLSVADTKSFKSKLAELSQKAAIDYPSYDTVHVDDGYISTVTFNGDTFRGRKKSKKKKAEHVAAHMCLFRLRQVEEAPEGYNPQTDGQPQQPSFVLDEGDSEDETATAWTIEKSAQACPDINLINDDASSRDLMPVGKQETNEYISMFPSLLSEADLSIYDPNSVVLEDLSYYGLTIVTPEPRQNTLHVPSKKRKHRETITEALLQENTTLKELNHGRVDVTPADAGNSNPNWNNFQASPETMNRNSPYPRPKKRRRDIVENKSDKVFRNKRKIYDSIVNDS